MPVHGTVAVSWGNDCVQTLNEPIPWIWDGLVAQDAVTLLSAPEKTGRSAILVGNDSSPFPRTSGPVANGGPLDAVLINPLNTGTCVDHRHPVDQWTDYQGGPSPLIR